MMDNIVRFTFLLFIVQGMLNGFFFCRGESFVIVEEPGHLEATKMGSKVVLAILIRLLLLP